MGELNFESQDNVVLLNPRMPADQAERLRGWLHVADGLTGHFFVLTSGSTAASEAGYKWVALSRQAILTSAAAVNTHLASDSRDVWLHCLPEFHVGGIGIYARAYLSEAKVVPFDGKWDAESFLAALHETGATLCSLVPAQLHDLMALEHRVDVEKPLALRAVLVGGGALSLNLFERAQINGWVVLPSYGMTETAAAIAAAPIESVDIISSCPPMRLLGHCQAISDIQTGRLAIRGESLFTGYISLDASGKPHFWDPKSSDGWFLTEDIGQVVDGAVEIDGRLQDRIKIGGETTHLMPLRKTLDDCIPSDRLRDSIALHAAKDERLEYVIELVVEKRVDEDTVKAIFADYNSRRLPFERIRRIRRVERIPHTELGKVKWGELSMDEPSS